MTTVSTPRKITTTATTGATLAKGSLTPVDASSGALTMTLPTTAAAGVELSVEKVDASANAVTVTGTLRGTAASTISLTSQYEARTFLSEGGGSWRPISDHRPKTALDATYAGINAARWRQAVPSVRPSQMLTTFQPSHGWNRSGTSGTVTDDTTTYALGQQSLKAVSAGTGTNVDIRNTVGTVWDATGKHFVFWIKIDDLSKVNGIFFRIGDSTFANRYVATIVNAASSPFLTSGDWCRITVAFSDLTVDAGAPTKSNLSLVQLSVSDKGTGPVTVNFGGIGLMPAPSPFPNGVLSLTFDDGWISQFSIARALLDKYGFPATYYTIAGNVGVAGRMSLSNLQDLEAFSGGEVAGHAYTQANHDTGFPNISPAALANEVNSLKGWLLDNGFRGLDQFAYPGGQINSDVDHAVGKMFASGRSIVGNHNETIPPAQRMRIRSTSPSNVTTAASLTAKIDAAYANQTWQVFTFHDIVTGTASGSAQYTLTNFQTVIDYAATKGIPVRIVSDVLRSVT